MPNISVVAVETRTMPPTIILIGKTGVRYAKVFEKKDKSFKDEIKAIKEGGDQYNVSSYTKIDDEKHGTVCEAMTSSNSAKERLQEAKRNTSDAKKVVKEANKALTAALSKEKKAIAEASAAKAVAGERKKRDRVNAAAAYVEEEAKPKAKAKKEESNVVNEALNELDNRYRKRTTKISITC